MAAKPAQGSRAGWRRRRPLRLNLALQGGGAHGAFTWGVLDRLLEDEGFAFEGISGTSAGALNAVTLASGWLSGGPAAARHALATLWHEVAGLARFSPLRAGGMTQMAADFAAQLLSPYQLNPLGLNPLRKILGQLVDFERLQGERGVALFIAATDLRSGAARIFRNRELTADALLASACLPQLHQAVAIDGAAYWDGGFVSNPPLVPLVEGCRTRDVLLVQINPTRVAALPRSARDIRNRMGEIVFGRPLLAELEMLGERARRARSPLGWWSRAGRRLARHRLHLIDGGAVLAELDPTTKIDPDWALLLQLRDLGRAAAEAWLDAGRGGPLRRRRPPQPARADLRPPLSRVVKP
jgi:NTE family protein